MLSWIIIVLCILIVIVLTKIKHVKHRTFVILIVLLVLFIYGTLVIVNSRNKLDFSTSEGFFNSMKVYGGWLANGFQNVKVLAGNAVKMNWTSTNGTFIDNSKNNSKNKTKINNSVTYKIGSAKTSDKK